MQTHSPWHTLLGHKHFSKLTHSNGTDGQEVATVDLPFEQRSFHGLPIVVDGKERIALELALLLKSNLKCGIEGLADLPGAHTFIDITRVAANGFILRYTEKEGVVVFCGTAKFLNSLVEFFVGAETGNKSKEAHSTEACNFR
jgi:hypothetical protein